MLFVIVVAKLGSSPSAAAISFKVSSVPGAASMRALIAESISVARPTLCHVPFLPMYGLLFLC